MTVVHVEMTFCDRNVGRLADRSASMVHLWTHVSEADKIVEVLKPAVAARYVRGRYKRWPVAGYEHHRVAADTNGFLRIARVLDELRGSVFHHKLAAETASEAHALSRDLAARLPKKFQARLMPHLDADSLQNVFCCFFDCSDLPFVKQFINRSGADNVGRRRLGALLLSCSAAAAFGIGHGLSHPLGMRFAREKTPVSVQTEG